MVMKGYPDIEFSKGHHDLAISKVVTNITGRLRRQEIGPVYV